MPLGPKRTIRTQPISLRVPTDFCELLDEYVAFLGQDSDRSYVIVESVRKQFQADRKFQAQRRAATPTHAGGRVADEASGSPTNRVNEAVTAAGRRSD